MSQILHIFRKDVRRHWPDILVALALLVTYVWDQPAEWHPQDLRSQMLHQMLRGYLPFIVMLAWSLLIARVLLTEPLVGDRQFWVTRPYEWHKLLIAKALLVVVFVNLPLFAAQMFLLSRAGFSPAPHMAELLLVQVWWVGLLILPVTTLATLSSNIAQFLLTVLGILVFVIGLLILNTRVRYGGSILAQWLPAWIEPVLLLAAATAVVFLQYARRRTVGSRWLLIGAVLITITISTIRKQPPFSADLYLQASTSEQLPVQVSFDPALNEQRGAQFDKNKVSVWIPLLVSGIVPNGAASLDGAMVEIEAAGMRWNSGWFGTYQYFLPTLGKSQFIFLVDKSFFEHVKTAPATLHISLALTGFRAREVRRLVAPAGDFEAPGEAICSMWLHERDALHCRSPLGRPFLALTVLPQESTCPRDKREKEQYDNSALGGVSSWGSYRSAGPVLSPVQTFDLSFWREPRSRPDYSPFNVLCPGTPLNFGILREDRRTRGVLTIEGIRLADYQPKELSSSGVGFGFAVAR